MDIRYQIVFLGFNPFVPQIIRTTISRVMDLGLHIDYIAFIDERNFHSSYKANAPSFCLYFGQTSRPFPSMHMLEILKRDASLILPVVEDLDLFPDSIPEVLHTINGIQLSSSEHIEALVSSILEGLGLLRLSRRLFISYKRTESSAVAIQLFEQFEQCGFDVFLDTHSIRPGDEFQEELWHRMVDSDIIVLLNTPDFLDSEWTSEELARANAMSIGILQLIWPSHTLERDAELSISLTLLDSDFGNNKFANAGSYLTDSAISNVIREAESLRARSLAARQDNIVTEFVSSADRLGVKVDVQPGKFITMKNSMNEELFIIPTVGVPQAFMYNQSEELADRITKGGGKKVFLLYNHMNIRDSWLKHLSWLDNHLPIKTIKITKVETWLESV